MESPIKWAGGKSLLVPIVKEWIESYCANANNNEYVFVDLFCGSLAIPIHLNASQFILNDRNRSLIHMYKIIQNNMEELLIYLRELNGEEYNTSEKFYEIREIYNQEKQQVELSIQHAAHFIYLNKRSFNGLYRENQSGEYNVPYREYKSPIYNEIVIRNLHRFFNERRVEFISENYETVLNSIPRNAIVYIDPPYYPVDGKSQFVSYTQYGFSVRDQENLCQMIRTLHQRGIKFILSNTPCPEIQRMYSGFYQETFHITRSMRSAKGKTRANQEPNEILITNIK